MPSDSLYTDKIAFIVAFFAGLITLNFYSEFFKTIILFIGIYKYPSIMILNAMVATLFVSVYLFALDYIMPESSYKLKNVLHFKWAGNLFYALTLIILPISIIIHGISYFLVKMNVKTELIGLIFIIMSIISSIITILFSVRITRREKEEKVGAIQLKEENAMKQAEELYKENHFSAALIEMGKLIEITIKKELLQKKNIDIKRASLVKLIDIALKTEIIDSNIASSIQEIRFIRNKAAHLDFEFKKEDAEWALNETNKILQILDPKVQWP